MEAAAAREGIREFSVITTPTRSTGL